MIGAIGIRVSPLLSYTRLSDQFSIHNTGSSDSEFSDSLSCIRAYLVNETQGYDLVYI